MTLFVFPLSSFLFTFWFFLLGTAIGSFLNVVILRHESEKKITGRSQCPHCHKQLTWKELVPVFSYVFQRGKCRGCNTRISPQYPLVELATGTLFSFVFFHVASPSLLTNHFSLITLVELNLHLAIWSILVVITVYDLRTKLIPDIFSYTFSVLALTALILTSLITNHFSLTTFLAGPPLFLPFYLLWKVSHGRWMGLGDGKLALGIGWFLDLDGGGSAILLSFWIGAAVSLVYMALQRMSRHYSPTTNHHPLTLKSEIPFGPFMVLGTLIVYLTGFSIVSLVW